MFSHTFEVKIVQLIFNQGYQLDKISYFLKWFRMYLIKYCLCCVCVWGVHNQSIIHIRTNFFLYIKMGFLMV